MSDFILYMLLLLAVVCVLAGVSFLISHFRHRLAVEQISHSVSRSVIHDQQQLLISNIREKILTSGYSSYQKAIADLSAVYKLPLQRLRSTYPELTDLDIAVLLLLAIGLDNHEIIVFLDMSKRTYYKRRQLIAGRVGLTASQLDQFAYSIFL